MDEESWPPEGFAFRSPLSATNVWLRNESIPYCCSRRVLPLRWSVIARV